MNILDLRTVLFSYVISNAICAIVMVALWLQNRKASPELGFWLAGFILQFLAILLIVLRGKAPDFISIVIGNSMLIGQVLLVYIGLERYVGKTSSQLHNYILLALFVFVHAYFTYAQPSLLARNLNVSLGLMVICSQCAWLMLRRVDVEMRPTTKIVGFIFAAYGLVSVVRVFIDLAAPPGNDLFKSDVYDTLVVLTYQMLSIALTFGLFLMVNRRLFAELAGGILERKQAEQALAQSEKDFRAIVEGTLVGVYKNSLKGEIMYVNEALSRMLEFESPADLMATGAIARYANPEDRKRMLDQLMQNGRVEAFEVDLLTKKNATKNVVLNVTLVGEVITGMIVDNTDRKRAELELRYLSIHDALTGLYNRGHFEDTMARLERGRQFPVSIVMADVDDLKETNDREGHAAGDTLLKRVAQILTAAFRAEDIIARIGGDEFAVLLPDTDAAAAEAALRRLQRALQEHNAAHAGRPVRLSFSASTAEERAPLTDVLKEADENMYREKRGHDVP